VVLVDLDQLGQHHVLEVLEPLLAHF